MNPELSLHEPWMVAAWPGMGAVGHIAGSHLVRALGAELLEELPAEAGFDVRAVPIERGLVQPALMPRNLLYGWKNPDPDGRDLLIFLGEQQPTDHGFAFAKELLEVAERLGASRVHTFAALATPVHPTDPSRVFAVATRRKLLGEVTTHGGLRLEEGELSGLNGVLLAAAATREMDGVCLLGEFPYFASRTPNPKASRAVLEVFARLAGIELDLSPLDAHVEKVQAQLTQALEAMEAAGESLSALGAQLGEEEPLSDPGPVTSAEPEPEPAPAEPGLDAEAEQRIEELFEATAKDRARATEFKAELDRHGVFRRYEDRFLDLFRPKDDGETDES